MKTGYMVHVVAVLTLALGVWIFLDDDASSERSNDEAPEKHELAVSDQVPDSKTEVTSSQSSLSTHKSLSQNLSQPLADSLSSQLDDSVVSSESDHMAVVDHKVVIEDYVAAWRNKDKATVEALWRKIVACEACLQRLVEMIVNKSLDEGLMLEAAIKMAALETNVVLPVFDVLIDPAGNRSAAIILSEKIINNGRPEFVTKIFDVIYSAKQNGYDNFARQLTWVISKLDNHEGIQPILDTITGRRATSPEFSDHVANVFSKVVYNLPESGEAATAISEYYLQANGSEQQKLWGVVSQHKDTLVLLAANADRNGQQYDIQKYASAISELPNLQAVDGLVKLHMNVEYSPDYLAGMLRDNVVKNPTIKVLHKLEDYMRDPDVDMDSRIFAAEGLLSVRENRQARYILQKVVNNPQYADAELQAYIGGRL